MWRRYSGVSQWVTQASTLEARLDRCVARCELLGGCGVFVPGVAHVASVRCGLVTGQARFHVPAAPGGPPRFGPAVGREQHRATGAGGRGRRRSACAPGGVVRSWWRPRFERPAVAAMWAVAKVRLSAAFRSRPSPERGLSWIAFHHGAHGCRGLGWPAEVWMPRVSLGVTS